MGGENIWRVLVRRKTWIGMATFGGQETECGCWIDMDRTGVLPRYGIRAGLFHTWRSEDGRHTISHRHPPSPAGWGEWGALTVKSDFPAAGSQTIKVETTKRYLQMVGIWQRLVWSLFNHHLPSVDHNSRIGGPFLGVFFGSFHIRMAVLLSKCMLFVFMDVPGVASGVL